MEVKLNGKPVKFLRIECSTLETAPPSNPIPPYPWVATDLFELQVTHYLLLVDYFSRYLHEIIKLRSTTSTAVIEFMKEIFACHGIPELLVNMQSSSKSKAGQGSNSSSGQGSRYVHSPCMRTTLCSKKCLELARGGACRRGQISRGGVSGRGQILVKSQGQILA